MKKIALLTVAAMMAFSAPAFAHGGHGNGLSVGLGVATGHGGLLGSLLGGNGRGNGGLLVDVGVKTGRNGVLGLLLGGGNDRGGHDHGGYGHGGYGHGGCGCH